MVRALFGEMRYSNATFSKAYILLIPPSVVIYQLLRKSDISHKEQVISMSKSNVYFMLIDKSRE